MKIQNHHYSTAVEYPGKYRYIKILPQKPKFLQKYATNELKR